MTETEWLNATEPQAMLRFLRASGAKSGAAKDRRLRLFSCACCRRIWGLMTGEKSRRAVEVAELDADGQAAEGERAAALRGATRYSANAGVMGLATTQAVGAAAALLEPGGTVRDVAESASLAVAFAGQPQRMQVTSQTEEAAQAAILRDIFGNPHRPLRPIGRSLLGWNGGLLRQLAQAAYEHRHLPSGHLDPSRLAVLADALLDAGCTDDELLRHLREEGPHYRGCVAVDAVLELE
jgi:hypothetical protein